MKSNRGVDTEFLALVQKLDESHSNHNLGGLYAGRLRTRQNETEGIKRKWEELTGVPVPKKLKTEEFKPVELRKAAAATAAAAKTTKTASPTAAAAPSNEPIDVSSMPYNDIRRELKKRGIPSNGKKVDLVEALQKAMENERERREETARKKEKLRLGGEAKIEDVIMEEPEDEECVGKEATTEIEAEGVGDGKSIMGKASPDPKSATTKIDGEGGGKSILAKASPAPKGATIAKSSPAPKSALKPSKYAAKALVQSTTSAPSASSKTDQIAKEAKLVSTSKISSESNDSSKSTSSASNLSKASAVSKATSSSMQSTPSFKSTTSGSSGSSSAVKIAQEKKKIAENNAARSAKYAEMKAKSKSDKAALGSASKLYSSSKIVTSITSSTASKLKPGTAPSTSTIKSKTNPILAKMREKAAAEKAAAPSAQSAQTTKPLTAPTSSTSVSSFKPPAPQLKPTSPPRKEPTANTLRKDSPQIKSVASKTALKHIIDPANKIASPKKKVEEKSLSPMQTYEMSDREESDSEDESDEEDDKPKKTIPEWAQRANLLRALEKQFADGPHRMDPDKYFGEVETCNLEEIFGDVKTKKRYHKRTSSGNWSKDHVTIAEKMAYKRTMGYDKL